MCDSNFVKQTLKLLQLLDNIKETISQNCDLQISQMKEKHILSLRHVMTL